VLGQCLFGLQIVECHFCARLLWLKKRGRAGQLAAVVDSHCDVPVRLTQVLQLHIRPVGLPRLLLLAQVAVKAVVKLLLIASRLYLRLLKVLQLPFVKPFTLFFLLLVFR
jgi:hypothetical protein